MKRKGWFGERSALASIPCLTCARTLKRELWFCSAIQPGLTSMKDSRTMPPPVAVVSLCSKGYLQALHCDNPASPISSDCVSTFPLHVDLHRQYRFAPTVVSAHRLRSVATGSWR